MHVAFSGLNYGHTSSKYHPKQLVTHTFVPLTATDPNSTSTITLQDTLE